MLITDPVAEQSIRWGIELFEKLPAKPLDAGHALFEAVQCKAALADRARVDVGRVCDLWLREDRDVTESASLNRHPVCDFIETDDVVVDNVRAAHLNNAFRFPGHSTRIAMASHSELLDFGELGCAAIEVESSIREACRSARDLGKFRQPLR